MNDSRPDFRTLWSPESYRGVQVRTLLTGIFLGLCLGLIVGWVIWPVKWTEAWPGDLSPEAKAQYLASVAEAYVYYGDAQAAEIARNRLFDLNDDLATQIAAAQAYFRDHPQRNSGVDIGLLGQLAQKLGVQSPDIIVVTEQPRAQAGTPGVVDSGASSPAQQPATGVTTRTTPMVRQWLNWIMIVLAALVLVTGGIYVIRLLSQRRYAMAGNGSFTDSEVDEFDDEPLPSGSTDSGRGRYPFMHASSRGSSTTRSGERPDAEPL